MKVHTPVGFLKVWGGVMLLILAFAAFVGVIGGFYWVTSVLGLWAAPIDMAGVALFFATIIYFGEDDDGY